MAYEDQLDDIRRTRIQAEINGQGSNAGERMRSAPPANMDELQKRLTKPPAPSAPEQRAVPPRNVPINGGSPMYVGKDGVVRPSINPNVGAAGSNEARIFRETRAAEIGPPKPASIAGAATAAPAAAAAPAGPSAYQSATQAASAQTPFGGPATAAGRTIANAGRMAVSGAAKASPYVGAGVEGYQVAKVAMDPNASKLDVATQTAEGVGRLASGAAGMGIGGALGAAVGGPLAPFTGPAGAVIGGATGYFGGDAAIKRGRDMMNNSQYVTDRVNDIRKFVTGLGPLERTNMDAASPADRAPSQMPQAQAAQPTDRPGPNGSRVSADGTVLTQRPTVQPGPAAAPAAPQQQRQQLNTGSGPRSPRTIEGVAQGQPQYTLGENAVEIIRPGGDRTVETFGQQLVQTPEGPRMMPVPEGAVPSEIFNLGQTAQWRATNAQALRDDMSDPKRELAKERIQNEGRLAERGLANKGALDVANVKQDREPKVSMPKTETDAMGRTVTTPGYRLSEDGKSFIEVPVQGQRPTPTPATIKRMLANMNNQQAKDEFKATFGIDPLTLKK